MMLYMYTCIYIGEEDLSDVMDAVRTRRSSYYPLGRKLGIRPTDLDAIHVYSTNLDQALNDVLLLWLRQEYNTLRFGEPSWRVLVKAVEDQSGLNSHLLAKEIALTHVMK